MVIVYECSDCIHGYIHPLETCKYCPLTSRLINHHSIACESIQRENPQKGEDNG